MCVSCAWQYDAMAQYQMRLMHRILTVKDGQKAGEIGDRWVLLKLVEGRPHTKFRLHVEIVTGGKNPAPTFGERYHSSYEMEQFSTSELIMREKREAHKGSPF